jgi:hypothetical protein
LTAVDGFPYTMTARGTASINIPPKIAPLARNCIVSMMNNRTTAYECRKDMSDVKNVERAGIYVEDVDMLPQMADDNNFCRQLISYRSLEKHGV